MSGSTWPGGACVAQGKQHPWEQTRGSPSPSTRPEPAQDTCSIPRSHVNIFPQSTASQNIQMREKGESRLGQRGTCSSLEKSPPCLPWGGGGCRGGLKAASPPILGTRICDRGGRGVSQGGKAGIATRDIYFFPKPRCETSAPSPELLGPQHITEDSFAELLSSRLSS